MSCVLHIAAKYAGILKYTLYCILRDLAGTKTGLYGMIISRLLTVLGFRVASYILREYFGGSTEAQIPGHAPPPPHLRCPFRIPVLNGNLVSDNGQAPESLPPSAFGMEACPLRNYVRCPEIGLPQPPGMPAVNADWFCPLPPVHPLSFLKVTTCLSRLPGNCLRPHSSIVKGSPRPPETTPGPQSAGVLRVPFRMGLRSYPTYCTSCGFPESDALRDGP